MMNIGDTRKDPPKTRILQGALFEPLGWTRDRLAAAADSEPDLLRDICSLSSQRMHLIAFSLAHLDGPQGSEMMRFLLRERAVKVFDCTLGRRPRGLKRALGKLFDLEVLTPEGYHRLVDLLDDPDGFKFLAHADCFGEGELQDLAV